MSRLWPVCGSFLYIDLGFVAKQLFGCLLSHLKKELGWNRVLILLFFKEKWVLNAELQLSVSGWVPACKENPKIWLAKLLFTILEWMNSSCCCFLNSSCAVVSAGGGLHCIWQRKLQINMCIMEEKHYRKTVICILQGNNPLSLLGLQ